MGIIEFTWGAMAGGIAYDGVKIILANSYDKLKDFFDNGKKEEFNSHLETILSVSEEIKTKLEELQNNTEININSKNIITVTGDSNTINIG
jgi:hypothetical protein